LNACTFFNLYAFDNYFSKCTPRRASSIFGGCLLLAGKCGTLFSAAWELLSSHSGQGSCLLPFAIWTDDFAGLFTFLHSFVGAGRMVIPMAMPIVPGPANVQYQMNFHCS